MSRTSVALALALAALGGLSASCTAILAPRDDVQRCGTADDCDPIDDERYVPVCKFDDANADLDSSQVDKICMASFKPSVGCDATTYEIDHEYRVAYEALADSARYVACTEEQLGMMGCRPPSGGSCSAGLSTNEFGLCDDDDDDTPVAVEVTTDTVGQDVRDQFCRSYFCDNRFICAPDNKCALCDPDEAVGEGGCGEIYYGGGRSCVYELYSSPDDDACQGPDVTTETVTFGTCMM